LKGCEDPQPEPPSSFAKAMEDRDVVSYEIRGAAGVPGVMLPGWAGCGGAMDSWGESAVVAVYCRRCLAILA